MLDPVLFALFSPRLAVPGRAPVPMMQTDFGGDLSGGSDAARNADVAKLKKLFYNEATSKSQPSEATADVTDALSADASLADAALGLHRDLPLARWQVVLLPHQQNRLNVFQPEYVHMFEQLLSTPKPWLYLHVLLPGGVDDLANPDYALPLNDLPAGGKATLHGTLMQVVGVKRLTDARLTLNVQALGRAVVLRGTQALPYARADVLSLPDSEALEAAATRLGRGSGTEPAVAASRRAAMLAAAAAEDRCWRAHEFAPADIGRANPPALACFEPAAAAMCAKSAAELATTASSATPAAELLVEWLEAGSEAVEAALAQAAAAAAEAAEVAAEEAAVSEVEWEEAASAVAEAEVDASLVALEVQVWLELDAFLRGLALRSGNGLPAPAQLLSLLPPPPAAGWPDEFLLKEIVISLRQEAAMKRSMDMFDQKSDPEPYIPYSAELYPARRRAQRLSFSIWTMIRDQNRDLQRVLEVSSTSDRLRLALLRLRELRERFKTNG